MQGGSSLDYTLFCLLFYESSSVQGLSGMALKDSSWTTGLPRAAWLSPDCNGAGLRSPSIPVNEIAVAASNFINNSIGSNE